MKTGTRLSLLLAILLILSACGVPSETGDSPGSTISTEPVAQPEESGVEIISATACKADDPWSMVETAFEGTVVSTEERLYPDREAGSEQGSGVRSGWVSFEVTRWYTTDFGTTFSMWAPDFYGQVGETWLVAGALYSVLGQQSGEVFPCVATPSTDTARQEWGGRFGAPVVAGSDVPESEPDPALVAQIEEQQAGWIAAGISDCTAVISSYQRDDVRFDDCGASGAPIRATVGDGIPTPDEMIVSFDPELGYPIEVRIDRIREAATTS